MITKEQLEASLLRECDIIAHLHGKLAPDSESYRPSSTQRSTIELLRYMSVCASAGIACLAAADWSLFAPYGSGVADMTMAEFPAAMTRQREEIQRFFADTSVEVLQSRETKMPGGGVVTLGVGVMNGPLKWLVAYKMQLFLYAKANGATEIGTSNLWGGADRQPARSAT